jgi:hypothetical protein
MCLYRKQKKRTVHFEFNYQHEKFNIHIRTDGRHTTVKFKTAVEAIRSDIRQGTNSYIDDNQACQSDRKAQTGKVRHKCCNRPI